MADHSLVNSSTPPRMRRVRRGSVHKGPTSASKRDSLLGRRNHELHVLITMDKIGSKSSTILGDSGSQPGVRVPLKERLYRLYCQCGALWDSSLKPVTVNVSNAVSTLTLHQPNYIDLAATHGDGVIKLA
ncbi:hypothetical protein UY3_08029 [Chelonia mydas]|uniref:Uncharacterized protein n=1 Tax=Chelonia mydas TaxID=8469 RepID=M7C323_CHEMY|nr:hypothetical protein UY3_08029 [Chelonia mydas]